jgi:hypothetical protein
MERGDMESGGHLVPPSSPKNRREKAALVESWVRRSPRIMELNYGFRNHLIALIETTYLVLLLHPVQRQK